ncbi:MAG TPA: glycosyltransferase family 9 protein [Bacteroidales bacterium]|nr:glycosyltransferase family 9 protein [Bacteroidales bacterium]
MIRILVIRLSAMGDVVLTLPVLHAFRKEYPEVKIMVFTKPVFRDFFISDPETELFAPDLKSGYKGLSGIIKLYFQLRRTGRFDYIIDLHNVIRSRVIDFFFRVTGVPVFILDKGRREKRELISGRKKVRLKHSVERYCDVFAAAGFNIKPVVGKILFPARVSEKKVSILFGDKFDDKSALHIGVAPFAKHELKQWPVENMIALLKMISARKKVWFWLFGGADEYRKVEEIEKAVGSATNLCGRMTLSDQIAIMERLSFMIAMDSSNMHMASLAGTSVISIWGGTDPLAGFGAWGQPEEYSIKIPFEVLNCRPCSVYGKGKCKRGDFACMTQLTPEKVFEQIIKLKIL